MKLVIKNTIEKLAHTSISARSVKSQFLAVSQFAEENKKRSFTMKSPLNFLARPLWVGLLCLLNLTAFSQPSDVPEKDQYNPKDQYFRPLSPAEAIKTIEVPAGYHLECVASEPMVQEPASFVFDEDGAIYVCEWLTYMQDEYGKNQLDEICRVVKLVDTDGDGIMDVRTVFIDKTRLPRTILPLKDRVLVIFTEETSIYAYFDDDRDGVSDRREVAYQGQPIGGNIEHQLSGLIWNLDNYIYNSDKRFKYVGGKLMPESYSKGRITQWGLARDDDGRVYCSWAGGGNPAHSFQFPGGYPILNLSKEDEHAPGYDTPHAICRVEDQSSGNYDFKNNRILTVFSATCGQTVLRSDLTPQWYGNVATPEPVGRLIRMSTIKNENGKRVAHNTFPQGEFIRDTDPFFRPVWSESGPDGCFYFSDMYRGIIQEKAWFPHEGDHIWVKRYERVKEWGMLKVFRHGRIYRLVPNGIKPAPATKLKNLPSNELVKHLSSGNGWIRDTAQKLIVYNQDMSVVDELTRLASTAPSINTRLVALWSLEGLGRLDEKTLSRALKDGEERVRLAGIHLAEKFLAEGNKSVEAQVLAMAVGASPDTAMQLTLSLKPALDPSYDEARRRIASKHPEHPLIGLFLKEEETRMNQSRLSASARSGLKLYETLCIICHGNDGLGVKQEGKFLAPQLTNNRWFTKRRVDVISRILLKGETGPIGKETYGEGLMLPLETAYNDEQLADLINYVGLTWNKWNTPVKAAEVQKIRAEIAGREKPYTNEELESIRN